MRVDKQIKEVICQSNSKRLVEVLEKELEEFYRNLKNSPDFGLIRYYQGYISAIEEVLELLTKK